MSHVVDALKLAWGRGRRQFSCNRVATSGEAELELKLIQKSMLRVEVGKMVR
jgi:hypothetical protein